MTLPAALRLVGALLAVAAVGSVLTGLFSVAGTWEAGSGLNASLALLLLFLGGAVQSLWQALAGAALALLCFAAARLLDTARWLGNDAGAGPMPIDAFSKAGQSVYLRRPGGQPTYQLGPQGRLVAEEPNLFTVYEATILASDGRRHRHALEVPVAMSAVSFSVGLALEEEDSRKLETGDTVSIRRLAGNVQYAFGRYRTFPVPWPPRFII